MKSIDLVACHLVGDYVLQPDVMAKKKFDDPTIRAHHVTRYSVPFLIAGLLRRERPGRLALFLALNWVTHYITDSRRWLPKPEWPPGTVLNDQALHFVQLAILSRLLKD